MRVCAVIIAGGRSSRMGRDKAFALVRGRTILDRVIATLSVQVEQVIINANGEAERFRETGLAVIGDLRTDVQTPLAGLHAALSHACASGFEAVLTTPCDAPFLPADLVTRLAAAQSTAAIAASAGQQHYLTGLWHASLLPRIALALDEPRPPRLQDWARACGAAVVEWTAQPYDPFLNVNTPDELAEAERIAAKFGL